MGIIKDQGGTVYRDSVTAGVPASGPNDPAKSEIRALFGTIDQTVTGAVAGIIYYPTGTARAADTAQAVGKIGKAADEADYYRREGAGWVVDNTVYDGVASLVQPELDAAQADASNALSAVVPLATATVASNTTTATVYNVALPSGFDASVNGQMFRIIAPATALGAVVQLNVSGVGTRDVFFAVGQQIRLGWEATFATNNGGNKFDLKSQAAAGVDLAVAERTGSAVRDGLAQAVGADAILEPINGSPNNLYADVRDVVNDDSFWFSVLETTTADGPLITDAQGNIFAVTECPAGTLRKGDLARIVFSGGINNWIYRERRTVPKLVDLGQVGEIDLVAKFVSDVHAAQWNLSGTPVDFPITAAGSSVTTEISRGREGATDYAPSHRLVDNLNGPAALSGDTGIPLGARIPGTRFIDDNWSHGGHVVSQFPGQLSESSYWNAGTTRALFLAPGPNDFQEASYNTGQTLPGAIAVLESMIVAARDRGIPVIIALPFDPDPTQNNHASFFTNNPTIPQNYPTFVANPVNPETGQYPPASDSVGTADMTGRGIAIPFDRRFEHGSALIRGLAVKYSKVVVLIDSRKSFHKAVEAIMPNAYEQRILYNTGDFIHPTTYAHVRGFGFPLIDFAQDVLAGRPIAPSYDGGDRRGFGA